MDYTSVFRFFAFILGFICALLLAQLFAKGFDNK
jgi:hypothetical protein